MAISINGSNYGIAVDGNLTIEHVDFGFGGGIQSASGIHQESSEDIETIEAESVPTVDGRNGTFPEVTQQNTDFFEKAFWVTREINGCVDRQLIDVPATWILHTIYDTTADWNPLDVASVHKWKILYEVLRRQKYFRIETKHCYAKYVKAVVAYCFPDVEGSNYANNISKTKLDEHIENWAAPDKQLYQQLKAALTVACP